MEFELRDSPLDWISSLSFSSSSAEGALNSYLVASSWDKSVRLYDVANNKQLYKSHTSTGPVLDCAFGDSPSVVYSAGMDRHITKIDFETGTEIIYPSHHTDTIKTLDFCQETHLIVSGSWDRSLAFWNDKDSNSAPIDRISLPERVYAADLKNGKLAVAMADRQIWLFDMRNTSMPLQKRESSLKHQCRVIRLGNNGLFILGSIEGRVCVDFIDPSQQSLKYAFKCHRGPNPIDPSSEIVYPVNAVAVHPITNAFATGGSDCFVNIWDAKHRKRLRQLPKYTNGISCLDFSKDGNYLAIAVCYGYENGTSSSNNNSSNCGIWIRPLSETDVKPKEK